MAPLKGRLPALLNTNILGWEILPRTNTLAYCRRKKFNNNVVSWVLTDDERKQRLLQRNRRRQTVVCPTVGTVTPRFTTEEHQVSML
jgi:hypothetical protein